MGRRERRGYRCCNLKELQARVTVLFDPPHAATGTSERPPPDCPAVEAGFIYRIQEPNRDIEVWWDTSGTLYLPGGRRPAAHGELPAGSGGDSALIIFARRGRHR